MAKETADLPLRHDAASRFVPYVIAVMVYMAALALAGAMLVASAVGGWTEGLRGTMTVHIMPNPAGAAATAKDLEKALTLLRADPHIAAARALDETASRALLKPWLGAGAAAAEIPVPRLIDVSLRRGAKLDPNALAARLRKAVPGAELDDHRRWLSRLLGLAGSLETVALLVLMLAAAAAALAVVFAARAGLAVHKRAIEILHLIGARDTYIAVQFQRRAFMQALMGGVVGLGAAIASLLAMGKLFGGVELFGLNQVRFGPLHWTALAALAPGAALIAMAAARFTVLRSLARRL
ncbi:MAG TPA: cell division protein [Alphaproteobacteria bacterium]|nr:cell division protein [Alphaproteobacteria bacterium]